MHIKHALQRIVSRQSLSIEAMTDIITQMLSGRLTDAQIAAFLVGLQMKGESIDEIVATARVLRNMVEPVRIKDTNAVDTCGTGGDNTSIFNVSTASALVAAAAGVTVAKHGNRKASSKTGSADVLEAAGVDITLKAQQVAQCINDIGIGFMFSQVHHTGMRHVVGPRKEIKLRTLFNQVGPLANPAKLRRQVLGVYDEALLNVMAKALQALGSVHAMVVHADDGLDEISIAAETQVVELTEGSLHQWRIRPDNYGIQMQSIDALIVNNADESLNLILSAFTNKADAQTQCAINLIALNAGAAIYVSGKVNDYRTGIETAQQTIRSGAASHKFDQLVNYHQGADTKTSVGTLDWSMKPIV